MIGKRAKILSPDHVEDLLVFARQTRHPIRNQVLVLLSVKAGLRAGEIAKLTWPMLAEPTGEIGTSLELLDSAAKNGGGRVIPIHPDLHAALIKLARLTLVPDGPVIRSERGGAPDLHHPGGQARAQGRRFLARRSIARRPPFNPDYATVHRRR
jgi:integrase